MDKHMLDLLKKWKIYTFADIHTMIPGKILEFDAVKMEATVLPLAKTILAGKEVNPQPIERCPVCFLNDSTFSIRHPLKKDDLVIIGFSEVSLEKILKSKEPSSVINSKRFNITDGIIIGTIDGENDTMPKVNSEDLLIINKETGHKIVFKKDGSIDTTVEVITALNATSINAPNATINCKNLNASEDVKAGEISLKEHLHSYDKPEHVVGTANTSAPKESGKNGI